MLDCTKNQENCMRNPGCIDEIKLIGNVIILALSRRGHVPTDSSKINMLTEAMKRCQIDAVLLNETNTKWNATNAERMENKLKK